MPFKPGQSGNPAGRPEGARDRLKNNFLTALADDFREHGVAAIRKVREETPSVYIKAIASLMPKEFKVNQDNPFEQLTDEQLAGLIALASGLDSSGSERAAVNKASEKKSKAVH